MGTTCCTQNNNNEYIPIYKQKRIKNMDTHDIRHNIIQSNINSGHITNILSDDDNVNLLENESQCNSIQYSVENKSNYTTDITVSQEQSSDYLIKEVKQNICGC